MPESQVDGPTQAQEDQEVGLDGLNGTLVITRYQENI